MPRPKRPGAPEPKRRSRNGCWPCKARKVKCGEERPTCNNCQRSGEACDYSIRLNWDGRRAKKPKLPAGSFGHFSITSGQSSVRSGSASTGAGSAGRESSFQISVAPNSGFNADLLSQDTPLRFDAGLDHHAGLGPAVVPDGQPIHPYGLMRSVELFTPGYGIPPVLEREAAEPGASQTSPVAPLPETSQRPPRQARQSFDSPNPEAPGPAPWSPTSSTAGSQSAAPRHASVVQSLRPMSSPGTPYASPYSDTDSESRVSEKPCPTSDPRRLSVSSLLSGPSTSSSTTGTQSNDAQREPSCSRTPAGHSPSSFYGIDRGFRDLDIPRNDDMNAITGHSPIIARDRKHYFFEIGDEDSLVEFGFGNNLEFGSGGYYDKPVAIRIPRRLEPLPSKLRDNPMNLLYFHHFINHTARVLVPYDDPLANPFRNVLPQMAVKNDNLMSLLLAYSASHRARLLQQPEPAMRIALWVQDIFPALRQALNDPTKSISNANVATAIMLASLEIISPTAFGYNIPWQQHLSLARKLITARPGGMATTDTDREEQQVCLFLWSWFAYMDVLGSLSGGPGDSSAAWLMAHAHPEKDAEGYNEIECLMGFTTRCVYILAGIAELARECDAERIGPDHRVLPGWRPSAAAVARASQLEADVRGSLAHPSKPCAHIRNAGDLAKWNAAEMAASNESYHCAGLVQLYRRVLGRSSGHPDVQWAVERIMACLRRIRKGGSAEACLIFPMFVAGCDTTDEAHRAHVLDRLKCAEGRGMTQVRKARRLMQRVWDTGQPWETLLSTEFIG